MRAGDLLDARLEGERPGALVEAVGGEHPQGDPREDAEGAQREPRRVEDLRLLGRRAVQQIAAREHQSETDHLGREAPERLPRPVRPGADRAGQRLSIDVAHVLQAEPGGVERLAQAMEARAGPDCRRRRPGIGLDDPRERIEGDERARRLAERRERVAGTGDAHRPVVSGEERGQGRLVARRRDLPWCAADATRPVSPRLGHRASRAPGSLHHGRISLTSSERRRQVPGLWAVGPAAMACGTRRFLYDDGVSEPVQSATTTLPGVRVPGSTRAWPIRSAGPRRSRRRGAGRRSSCISTWKARFGPQPSASWPRATIRPHRWSGRTGMSATGRFATWPASSSSSGG